MQVWKCLVEGDIELVQPRSDDEEDDWDVLSVVDDDLSTSHLRQEAAASLGLTQNSGTTLSGTGPLPVENSRKRAVGQRGGEQRAKRPATGV